MTSEVEVDPIFPGDFPMAPPSPSPGISEIFPGNPLEIPVFFFSRISHTPWNFPLIFSTGGCKFCSGEAQCVSRVVSSSFSE